MNDTNITIVDVMNGVDKMSLCTRMSPPTFKFFIGLILEANRLGFRKNPFELTVAQAIGAGGGSSRQSLHITRAKLARVRIEGEPLLTVTEGDMQSNTQALYEINYGLLTRYNNTWGQKENPRQEKLTRGASRKVDAGASRKVDHPRIREEEIREDLSPQGPDPVLHTEAAAENSGEKEKNKIDMILDLIQKLWPGYVAQPNTVQMEDVEEIAQYERESIEEAFAAAQKEHISRGKFWWIKNRLEAPEKYGVVPAKSYAETVADQVAEMLDLDEEGM